MKILIDIGHPAHVHLFKNFAWQMSKKGHRVAFTCRDREHITHLLSSCGFTYTNFGKHYFSILGKFFGLVKNEIQMLITCLKFAPDILVSHSSVVAAIASFILGKKHIALEDTFNMEQVRLSMLFTDAVLTGDYPHPSLGEKERQYPGYHELAYLHPNVYKPSEDILNCMGVIKGEKYAIVRFIAWNASHDIGLKGLNTENKVKLVHELSRKVRVFISSEDELPPELSDYRIQIDPAQIHDALYYAHLFIGESATMASECAMLGTPAIFLHNKHFGSIDNQAEYGLIHQFSDSLADQQRAISKALALVSSDGSKQSACESSNSMIKDKIDVSCFMVWFVENYPKSASEMKDKCFNFEQFKYQPSELETVSQS